MMPPSPIPTTSCYVLQKAYLTFAEADARLNGGNTTSEGTQAVNSIRSRAHASTRTKCI